MELEKWTLFIDMLGYGQMNGSIRDKEEAAAFISFMKSNVGLFEDQDNVVYIGSNLTIIVDFATFK